jgi:hypothetical protein
MTEAEIPSEPLSPRTLDPFDFHGHPASAIIGLGGEAAIPEPTYAFHTSYVPVARGHAHFTVKFDGLQARRGTLWIRIHMLPNGPGAVARMVTGQRIQLNWLAHHGGEIALRFEAFRGATYAIMGMVPDESDAAAHGLTVTLDRPASEADLLDGASVAEAQSTAYGSNTIKGASLLLSIDRPVFAAPVSQPCTPEQLRERPFRNWAKQLGDSGSNNLAATWQSAYVMQVLDRYGLLQSGARGLAFGDAGALVGGLLKANGVSCDTVHLAAHGSGDGGEDETVISPAELPGELFAYDLMLSIRATDTLESERAAQAFLESAMECLRPGGLAIHIVAHRIEAGPSDIVAFDRNGLEKIMVAMISRGHQTARLKPVLQHTKIERTADGFVPFGLVTRRATSIL